MTDKLRNLTLVAVLAGSAVFAAGSGATMAAAEIREWKFRVFLDNKEIGFHDYRISELGDARRVETEASFDVRFLFFNAYRYRHRNVETWEDNCLTALEASTDANGEQLDVRGSFDDDGFVVDVGEGSERLPGCVRSFAYWDPGLLDAGRLLNAQTGEFENVEVSEAGTETLNFAGTELPARRYEIAVKGRTITVWYGDDGRWLSLESPARGGRVIRYEPVSLPGAPGSSAFVETARGLSRDI